MSAAPPMSRAVPCTVPSSGPSTEGMVGGVAYVTLGEGDPVTVLAHGIGGTHLQMRPLAQALRGTRVLLTFRGHGRSAPLPGRWDYDLLADDVLAVAGAERATAAIGLSLGAGALIRAVQRHPGRFERLAFVLPAAVDDPYDDVAARRLRRIGAAIEAKDRPTLAELLLEEVPHPLRERRGARLLAARRVEELLLHAPAFPLDDQERPVSDPAALRSVVAPALVIGQAADPFHPLPVAQRLAACLPDARLLQLPADGVFWTAPERAQSALAAHFNPVKEAA